MKAAGLALLASSFSCNQIFGIGKTQPWDAHGPIDAADWTTQITWQTLAGGQVTDDPIDGLTVQIASLDTGIAADDATITIPLTPVAVDASGTFAVPYQLAFEPYRVVFTAPDGVPTEIQTQLKSFHYAFPSYGRHDRGTVPAGATVSGSAVGEAGAYTGERLLTAGLWSVTEGSAAGTTGAFSFPYQAAATSLSGALGVPDAADGDVEVVAFTTGGAADAGYVVFAADGLGSAVAATWQNPPTIAIGWDDTSVLHASQRVSDSLGSLSGAIGMGSSASERWGGVIPAVAAGSAAPLPSFVQPLVAAASLDAPAAPPPVMLPLDESGASQLAFQDPFTGTASEGPLLPTAVYTGDFRTRVVPTVAGGSDALTRLTSSVQSVTLAAAGATVTPVDAAGIAESTESHPVTLSTTVLAAEYTQVPLGGAAAVPLTFDTDTPVDDCTVVLYRIEPTGTLTPRARYIVAAPASTVPIIVSTAYFDGSSLFTFGISCEVGHDFAANGATTDFTSVAFPFSASSTFTATFTTAP